MTGQPREYLEYEQGCLIGGIDGLVGTERLEGGRGRRAHVKGDGDIGS
jgi:hypothetical protein